MTRTEVTAARRVVVKVGLVLADDRRGRDRPGPRAALADALAGPVRAASRWSWSPPVRSRPGWRRSG